MPSGTPSMARTPFSDSDDRELVAFLAVHHPSKDGRKGNAIYKLLTEQPHRWPWGKRHTWSSWRERYKNNELRFDHHIKVFQYKNKLSKQAIPLGSEAMLVHGMEDLDDFGTDEEEDRQPRGKKAARVDSDTEDEDDGPARISSRPVSKATPPPEQPTSKRKRVSDTSDRTSKRTRVIQGGGSSEMEQESPTDGPAGEKEDDAMGQDSQGEETLEVEQDLFCPSDEDSLTILPNSHGVSTPTWSTRPPRSSGPVASTSKNQRTPQPREPIHRPHSPKNPPSSAFSTIEPDEIDSDSPIVPKRLRKRTVPKIVESAFGRNEQSSPVRSSQIRAHSSPEFDLLVERRAARKKAGAAGQLEVRQTEGGMSLEELRELRRNTPEPGPSSPSRSKRGSVEPRGPSPLSQSNGPPTPQPCPRPQSSDTVDATERRMIEAREELSKVVLGFRARLPRSPLGPKFPDTRMDDDETHPFDESTHPFDETTHPFDETMHPFGEITHPFDETTHPFDDSQAPSQEVHPFDEDSHIPSDEIHPFDEDTQPPDSLAGGQSQRWGSEVGSSDIRMAISPVPSTPRSSKRRTEAFLSTSLLESGNGRHSRSPSHPPPISPIGRLRPGLLCSPIRPSRSPQNPAMRELTTTNGPLGRLKVPTPITTSRNPLRSPLSPIEDDLGLSSRKARSGGVSPEDGRSKSTVTQELRELLENSPRTRRASANVEAQPQTRAKGPSKTSEPKQPVHRIRFSEPSVKPETTTPVHHLRSKSMVDDDPFSSPTGLRLSSPHPPTDATIPDAEQDSPLAPLTTSQNGLDATIKSRQVRRGAAQDKKRRSRDSERPTSTSLKSATVIATSTALRKSKEVAEAPVHADREEGGDAMDESQTYDIERDLYDVAGTPMMDLSVRPPRRIAPTHRAFPSHARHGTLSSITADSQDRDHEHGRDRDGRKSSSSRYREREVHLEKDVRDDSEQHWGSGRLSGVSFGQPIAASSPPDTRRTGRGQGYDRLARTASNTTTSSLSSRTSLGSSVRATSPAVGIMARPSGLGFAPSEMDAYLGIQVACEKIAKTHGFQSDAVFRVYQEVKDLRKAEEIVVGMKHAAEKDAIERIMKVREKSERRRTSERVGEGSSHRDRDGDPSRTSRRSYDIREQEEEGGDDDQEISQGIIYEEEGEDPDGQLRIEHLSHRSKRSSAPSTSAARHRGGYDRHRMPTAAVRKVREREDSVEYHPPTPTRASLWERLSKSGRHPETALLGESLRASLSMPRYETVDHE